MENVERSLFKMFGTLQSVQIWKILKVENQHFLNKRVFTFS